MPKYRVPMTGYASGTVDVETDATDPEEVFDAAMNAGAPTVCAQCAGWGRSHSLDIGDEWEPETDESGTITVYRLEE